jgi:hypothetical protein
VAKKNRDDFSPKTVLQIAKRAGWLCSFPTCRTPTVGATADGDGEINISTAAHIMTRKCRRRSAPPQKNGIWMRRDHGNAIDSDVKYFTTERLRGTLAAPSLR